MFGAVLMKRGKDGKDRLLNKEDVKPAENPTDSQTAYAMLDGKEVGKPTEEDFRTGLGHVGFALLSGSLWNRPKTYERLIHDLYTAGWTIEEVKTLLNGGNIEKKC